MGTSATPSADEQPRRRRYDSPVRREQSARTRERILTAASELVHELRTWDWQRLTFRAVAERAGVSERTVYRHFPTERDLHESVLARLEDDAGVSYEGLALKDFGDYMARALAKVPSFAVERWSDGQPETPALAAMNDRRRAAITTAVGEATTDWPESRRRMAVAVVDLLWNIPAFEHLHTAWNLGDDEATQALTWAINLVVAAIQRGERP